MELSPVEEHVTFTILKFLISEHGCWSSDMEKMSAAQVLDGNSCEIIENTNLDHWMELTTQVIKASLYVIQEEVLF